MAAIQYVDGPTKTLVAAAALGRCQLLKIDSAGKWAVSGASDTPVAVASRTVASGAQVAGILLNKQGTIPMIAAEAIPAATALNLAAAGEVTDQAGTALGGTNINAAAAQGDIIEVVMHT